MVELKRIGVLSAAKMAGVIELVVCAFLAAFLLVAGGVAVAFLGPTFSSLKGMGAFVLLVLPVIGAIMGFCGSAVLVFLYDVLASRMGGMTFELKGKRVDRVGIISVAKMAAVFGAFVGVVSGVSAAAVSVSASSVPVAIVVVAIAVIATSAILFAFAALLALLYNLAAPLLGGVTLDISGGKLAGIGIAPYAGMAGLFSMVGGLFDGIIFALMGSDPAVSATMPAAAATFGVLSVVIFPVAYFIFGFVCAALQAWLYNWLSGRIGGVALDMK